MTNLNFFQPKQDNHRSKVAVIILAAGIVLFTIGIAKLFVLRFESGDVYPAYSSLRSDPLGTLALYESLKDLKSISVERNFYAVSRLHPDPNTTIFYLGAHHSDFTNEASLNTFYELAISGARLVISFFPIPKSALLKNQKMYSEILSSEQLNQHWGVSFARDKTPADKQKEPDFAHRVQHSDFPESVSWHSSMYFDKLHSSWNILYTRDNHPVIIERQFGKGSIVLISDSYFLSNEALKNERYPELLIWLLKENPHILFDESHFGLQQTEGIVYLALKYNLHWLFFSLIILAGLFVWKNSVFFVPPPDDEFSLKIDKFTSRDSAEGFVSLVRRNIPQVDILRVCVEEWEKTIPRHRKISLQDKLEKIKSLTNTQRFISEKHNDPVKTYQTICRIVSEKNL